MQLPICYHKRGICACRQLQGALSMLDDRACFGISNSPHRATTTLNPSYPSNYSLATTVIYCSRFNVAFLHPLSWHDFRVFFIFRTPLNKCSLPSRRVNKPSSFPLFVYVLQLSALSYTSTHSDPRISAPAYLHQQVRVRDQAYTYKT